MHRLEDASEGAMADAVAPLEAQGVELHRRLGRPRPATADIGERFCCARGFPSTPMCSPKLKHQLIGIG